MTKRRMPAISTFAVLFALVLASWAAAQAPIADHRAGSLAKEEPQKVYAPDPADAWNRIFFCLFTRKVQTRLSDDFQEAKPLDPVKVRGLAISKGSFERIEGGDRAIEPFYPSHFVGYGQGPFERWVSPRFSQLKQALEEALREKTDPPPLARAMMQSDIWAAYDRLSAYEEQRREDRERRQQVLALFARFMKKLALTPQEIQALPNNYATAPQLPDLFSAESQWLEILWFPERIHEDFADYRRVARVFVKPVSPPIDKIAFLNGLRQANDISGRLSAVALVSQNLLVDRHGKIMASPLTYEVQVRRFLKNRDGKLVGVAVEQFELSRRLLLSNPKSGGFEFLEKTAPVYLASGGNDLDFASDVHDGKPDRQPVLVRLKTRCTECHEEHTKSVFTFDLHNRRFEYQRIAPDPPVALLKPLLNEHAQFVIQRKSERKEFSALQERWREE